MPTLKARIPSEADEEQNKEFQPKIKKVFDSINQALLRKV